MNNLTIFFKLLLPYKKHLGFTFISIIIANCAGLLLPWALKVIVDEVITARRRDELTMVCLVLLAAFLLRFVFSFLREYLSSFVGEKVVTDLRNKIYWHLHLLSVPYVENTPKGKIIAGITSDVESIRDFLSGGAVDFVYGVCNIIFVFAVLAALEWRLALVSFLYLPVFIVVFHIVTPRLKEKHAEVRNEFGNLTSRVSETLQGIRVVSGFGRSETEKERFGQQLSKIFRASLTSQRWSIFLWTAAEFLSSVALVTLLWFGVRQVIEGSLSVGTLMAFYSYLAMLFYPVIRMAIINDYYQEASSALARIRDVLGREPSIKEFPAARIVKKLEGSISFKDVGFGYDNAKEVLAGITFEIKRAEVVALVGKSGAGKTTLVNLLLRFYDPQRGEILVDGTNLKTLDLKSFRSRIAMVIQDDYLFGTTVRENIAYSRPGAGEEEIVSAAKGAFAHDFIIQLPGGYDTQVGERGVKLSYGQRQRISIARALLRDPDILILDEATSNIDSETEKNIIDKAFRNLMFDRTTIVIAHRLAAVNYADRVIFLEEGRITEIGSPDELIRKKGDYWKLFLNQRDAGLAVT